jgi:hypothetical protein
MREGLLRNLQFAVCAANLPAVVLQVVDDNPLSQAWGSTANAGLEFPSWKELFPDLHPPLSLSRSPNVSWLLVPCENSCHHEVHMRLKFQSSFTYQVVQLRSRLCVF